MGVAAFDDPQSETQTDYTEIWLPDDDEIIASLQATSQNGLLMWLVVQAPPQERGIVLAIAPQALMGRSREADLHWDDPALSRRHARFILAQSPEGPAYFIYPLEARKAIELNGLPIAGPMRLRENDRLLLGNTLFVVKLLEEAQ